MSVKVQIKNLGYIQKTDFRYAEAFEDVSNAVGNVANQTASDPSGTDNVPAKIGTFKAQHIGGGMLNFSFVDQSKVQRAVDYVAELADNPGFSGSEYVHYGPHKNNSVPVPNGNWYLKGYSQYRFGGPPSKPVIVGPIRVTGSLYSQRLQGEGCAAASPGTTGQGAGLTISR